MTAKARTPRTATTRTATPKAPTEAPVAPVTEAPVEAPVATPAEVTPEAPVATEAPVAPVPATVIKIGALTIDTADVTATVQAYADATVGDKTKIRNAIIAAMGQAVMATDLATAMTMATAQKALAEAAPAKQEIDLTQVVIDRAIGLAYAAKRLGYGDIVPEGMDESKVDKARVEAAFRAYMSGDMDAVSDDQAAIAKKVGTTKVTRTAERGSVEAHIEAAFAGTKVGTRLTVAQIRTASKAASDGAIAARVWPVGKDKVAKESTLDFTAMGIRPCLIDGVRGMEKFADVDA